MDCPVCDGSGVSPASRTQAAQELGWIVECGACGGSGIRRRQPHEWRPEPSASRDVNLGPGRFTPPEGSLDEGGWRAPSVRSSTRPSPACRPPC
jgi:hypothetical protein